MTTISVTYSPDDDKLRLSAAHQLDDETFKRVKANGFSWAPRQKVFFAIWTPEREDLALELAGEIKDEDSSLLDRAEDRADRFAAYSHSRQREADAAQRAVAAIVEHIPLGQPILVGHHSEGRARRDANRIGTGMRKAVDLWKTSQYWQDRAEAAIRHAKYKERPDVRARRIKTLEADERKSAKYKADFEPWLRLWSQEDLSASQALSIASQCRVIVARDGEAQRWTAWDVLQPEEERSPGCPTLTVVEVQEIAKSLFTASIARCDRWLAHFANRLAYERTMLANDGGIPSDQVKPEKGGACRCWASPRGGWSYILKVNKVSVTVPDNWGNGGANFTRTIPFDKLLALMTAAEVAQARAEGRLVEDRTATGFVLSDSPASRPTPQDGTPAEVSAAQHP